MDPAAEVDTTNVGLPVLPGMIIAGTYRIERLIGAGGMGVIVAATHLRLGQQVAIKFMSLTADRLGIRRFEREARAAARIRSEHVARVFDIAWLPSGAPYIVMECLDGTNLEDALHERLIFPVHHAVNVILQAGEAVAEAHGIGIVHRDLKPSNLFCCRRAHGLPFIKVLDFGISKLLPGAGRPRVTWLTDARAMMGSPLYVSPEQLRSSRDVDARTDIWAMGVILYELLSGQPPFIAETLPEICAKILEAPVPPVSARRPEIPAQLDRVLERALAKKREHRYASVPELAEALAPFATPRIGPYVPRVIGPRVVRVAGPERPKWTARLLAHGRLASSLTTRQEQPAADSRGRRRAKVAAAFASGSAAVLFLAFLASQVAAALNRPPPTPPPPPAYVSALGGSPAPVLLELAAGRANHPTGGLEFPPTEASPSTAPSPSPTGPPASASQRPRGRRPLETVGFGGLE